MIRRHPIGRIAGRRTLFRVAALVVLGAGFSSAAAAESLQVAYAGSMGVIMDRFLGPGFASAHSVQYQGVGQGSFALARLILAKQIRPDVFISVTRGPVELLLRAGMLNRAQPVASTEMVITYNPSGRFAPEFERAATATVPWYSVLESKGLRFGRTDPAVDPQGRNIIFTFLLAQHYYGKPGLERRILGSSENPAQIFTETSLLSRLEAGQLDASSAYRSSAVSHGLPYITLPPEINLGNAEYEKSWYSRVEFTIAGPDGTPRSVHVEPLVFYAGVPTNARRPELGNAFVAFLRSKGARALFARYGYGPPSGPALR